MAKVAVQCSADTFVVNQSLVLRINPDRYRDGENRQLLVATKPQWQKPKYAVKHFRVVLLIQGKLHTVMTVNGDIFEVKLPPKKQYAMKELRVIAYDFEGKSSLW